MGNRLNSFFIALFLLASCHSEPKKVNQTTTDNSHKTKIAIAKKPLANAATILSKKEVPILCYHNIKEFSSKTSDYAKVYTVTPSNFAEQMKALSDNGYHTILPNQLYDYLTHGGSLPTNPVMITFDDTREEQYTIGKTEMDKYGFKGVYFIMTVAINRPHYMNTEQIKNLSDNGHTIAAHTWDHHMVTKYTGDDWETQLVKPKAKLEKIIGKPINYFAYPFGIWNHDIIPQIKNSGYQMAFILATKRDSTAPLYTVRRIIVSGTWSTSGFFKSIQSSFK